MRTSLKHLFTSSVFVLLTACGGARSYPKDARTVVVSLDKIDCSDCGDGIVADLRERPGVYDARFDRRNAEVVVVASPGFDVFTAVRKLAAEDGFEAILGAGKGRYLDHVPFPEGADVHTVVEGGRDVPDLAPHLASGKVTVVDFSATWCGPCRKVDEHMVKVLGARKDVAYRRLDVGDWDTPLAKRYLANVPQLPYVVVYDKRGAAVDRIAGVDIARIDRAIEKGSLP
ncbi:thioredoxin family protein [Polyangium sorediatum]|uniref:Thioredoxin family protein n=1 Tax=Polyangium sorediatum TaxID=889274 RepID=A0ABT6NIH9_9BACT|nr:thioredoxin family protein [Polyangium sorediatum]MDI1428114.1 thioredoxin family protein [Polyangium sorediatum]